MNLISRIREKTYRKNANLTVGMRKDGHTLWIYPNVGNLIADRSEIMMQAWSELERTVTSDDLMLFCEKGKQALNEGDLSSVGALFNLLEANLMAQSYEKNLLRLGNACIILDNEPVSELSSKHTQIKIDLVKKYADVRVFFLKRGADICRELNGSKDSIKVEDFTKNPNLGIEKMFLKQIGSSMYEGWTSLGLKNTKQKK